MLQNFILFPRKKILSKYAPFVWQVWSDQVILLDSFKLFCPWVSVSEC